MGGEPHVWSDEELDAVADRAMLREREACAKIADEHSGGVGGMSAALVAQKIRSRGNS